MLRGQNVNMNLQNYRLNSSRAGFLYRAAKLFNSLPMEIKKEDNSKKFKIDVRKWILAYIPIKP